MLWPTLLFCHLLSGILCLILARRLRRAPLPWVLLAVPIGVLSLFLLLYSEERKKSAGADKPPG